MIAVTWAQFKSLVTSKALLIQHIQIDDRYYLKALDGAFVVDCVLSKYNESSSTEYRTVQIEYIDIDGEKKLKDEISPFEVPTKTPNTDYLDFEANYKTTSNKKLDIKKPFLDADGYKAKFQGFVSQVLDVGINYVYYKITEELWINGVRVIVKNALFGDSIDFDICDHDNVLGYGVDLVVNKFAENWFIAADVQQQEDVIVNYPAKIPANLYIRVSYDAGQAGTVLSCNLFLHKKT